MNYCGPRGIPWTTFLSWDRDSRDAAIVWAARQGQTCSSCGTRPDEWDPENGGADFAYRAEIENCRGCETLASGQQQLTKAHGAGARVVLVVNRS